MKHIIRLGQNILCFKQLDATLTLNVWGYIKNKISSSFTFLCLCFCYAITGKYVSKNVIDQFMLGFAILYHKVPSLSWLPIKRKNTKAIRNN